MKRLNFYISFLVLFFLCSCSLDDQLIEGNIAGNDEITEIKAIIAELETDEVQSRTSFTTGTYPTQPSPVWMVGDSIGIYPDEGDQLSFRIETSGKTCPFNGGGWAMKASSSYTAYSPFQRSYYYKEKNALPINMLGQVQTGNDNADHLGAYDIQIAKGDKPETGSLVFQFERKVALVRMELKAPCAATWKSVTLESNAAFTTKATMNLSLEVPTLTPTTQTNSISLALENVKTTSDNLNIIAYMMLLPVDLTGKSLSVKLTDVDDNVYTANATVTNNKTNISAGAARWITAEFEESTDTEEIPYVTFSAESTQSLTMSDVVEKLEYSVGNGEWKLLGTNIVWFGGDLGDLRLRGKNGTGTVNGWNPGATLYRDATIIFGYNVPVNCTGDIRTLVNYEDYTNCGSGKFCYLFEDCTCLISAPKLPATNLESYCYYFMFSGCTGLTEPPVLPATVLAEKCYWFMFSDCTGLTETPILPATTLAEGCYGGMFSGCTSLEEAPALPATTLAKGCYSGMFSGCSGLTKAPELPVLKLESVCYGSMFSNCTGLTEAPELPATNLESYCYYNMFSGCTGLTEAPVLPATTLAESCYSGMFSGCSGLTKAPELPALTLESYCYSNMFSNCTGLTEAPELPAKWLAKGCYGASYGSKGMFAGCTNLTTAPVLHAAYLAESCYSYMFSDCVKLNEVTILAIDISASDCLDNWLEGVSSTGTFIKSPEIDENSFESGSSGIPSGWTVVNYEENK